MAEQQVLVDGKKVVPGKKVKADVDLGKSVEQMIEESPKMASQKSAPEG
jgi:hypothetical protein